jgi:hypothetical protein
MSGQAMTCRPKKYDPRPGFKRKRLLKYERKQMEREVRAEHRGATAAQEPTIEAVRDEILCRLDAIERHEAPKKFAAGWTMSPDGHWVPPGYASIPGGGGPGEGTPRNFM